MQTHATTMADLGEPGGARGCRGGGQVGTKSRDRVPDVNCGVRVHRSVVPLPTHWPQPTGGSERKKDSRVKKVVSPRGAQVFTLITLISHVVAATVPRAALLHCCAFAAIAGTVKCCAHPLRPLGRPAGNCQSTRKSRLLAPQNP